LTIIETKNASRIYQTKSEQELRLIDYTFYFSGWTVYVDDNPIVIQYQDADYRGLITYKVPAGIHTIRVSYESTKMRSLGYLVTTCAIIVFLIYVLLMSQKKLWK
jgi:hypothetical protein